MRRALSLVAVVLAVGGEVVAQTPNVIPRIRGLAFDSLRGQPLANAFVAIAGGPWSTTSDARGRFELEMVPGGAQSIILQHATLDTLGFSGLTTRVLLTDGAEVRVGTPSFATLWRRACGDRPAPTDSGFVYGTVYDAAGSKPIAGAGISLVWYDSLGRRDPKVRLTSDNPRLASESTIRSAYELSNWRLRSRSDANGTYVVCGVPVRGLGILVNAQRDSSSTTDSIDVVMDVRVQRRDLLIPSRTGSGSVATGIVVGHLTNHAGAPLPNARVIVAGVSDRSDESGRFILREVAAGTRRVEVLTLGMRPVYASIDVIAGDTATLSLVVSRAQILAGMDVTAMPFGKVMKVEFESRRKLALGYVADSAEISRYRSITNVLRDVPSLQLMQRGGSLTASVSNDRGGQCTPIVWLDGVEAGYGNLLDLAPSEVAGLEVYTRPLNVPTQYREKGVGTKCGAIIVWTKYVFKYR
ncbi:MAG: carboxypeptidase regulatory-like domain-containing protein [Gemmatimonadota bacterium]